MLSGCGLSVYQQGCKTKKRMIDAPRQKAAKDIASQPTPKQNFQVLNTLRKLPQFIDPRNHIPMKDPLRNFVAATFIGIFASLSLSAQPGIYFEPWPVDVTAPNVRLYVDLSSPHCDCPALGNVNSDDNPLYLWAWYPNDFRPLLFGEDVNNGDWDNSNENLLMYQDEDNPDLWYYDFLGASLSDFYGVDESIFDHEDVHFLVKEKDGWGDPEPRSPDLIAYTQSAVPSTNIGSVIDFELFSPGTGAAGTNLAWSGVEGDTRLFRLSGSKAVAVADDGSILNPAFMDMAEPDGSGNTLHAFTGMAFSPNFNLTGRIFTYKVMVDDTGSLFNRISRYTITAGDPNQADMNSEEVILEFPQDTEENIAGHIEFGPDGFLYISTGDGGLPDDYLYRAQDLGNLSGKILRIDISSFPYLIPYGNPFLEVQDARPEVWMYGLRNPRRFAFDRENGDMYFTETNPNADSHNGKITRLEVGTGAGNNYGWSCYWGGEAVNPEICDSDPWMWLSPWTFSYQNSPWSNPQSLRCNITGGRAYRGEEHPEIAGRYLITDQCSREYWLSRPDLPGFNAFRSGPNLITPSGLTAMSENHAGEIFAASSENANIYKMIRPCADYTVTLSESGDDLQIQTNFTTSDLRWYVNGIPYHNTLPGDILVPEWDGVYQAVVRSAEGCEVLSNEIEFGILNTSSARRESDVRLFPNPAADQLRVHGTTHESTFEIFAVDGKRMRVGMAFESTDGHVIDVSSLSPGFYLLRITGAEREHKALSFIKF